MTYQGANAGDAAQHHDETSSADVEQKDNVQDQNWVKARETMGSLSRENRALKAELEAIKQKLEAPAKPSRPKDDIATYGDIEEKANEFEKTFERRLQALSVRSKHPDADEILEKYGSEVPAPVAKLIAQSGDLEAAIEACKLTPSFLRDQASKNRHPDAKRALDNLDKPKSPGMGATSAGAAATVAGLPANWKSMSREERLALQQKFMRG